MKVKMIRRPGWEWNEDGEWRSFPAPGEVLETNGAHAADLCRQGYAQPVTEERAAETRPAPATEEKRAAPAAKGKGAAAQKGD